MTMTAHGTRATNVLTFPKTTFSGSPKPHIKIHRTKCANVLKFTGKKIDNYDSEALRSEWEKGLVDQFVEMYERAVNGEFAGLMIVGACGAPTSDGEGPKGVISLSGVFSTDVAFAARAAKRAAKFVEERAEDYPARPL